MLSCPAVRLAASLVILPMLLLVAACAGPIGAGPSLSPSASPSPSLVPVTDEELAYDVASRFEAARAAGSFDAAWQLLGPAAQAAIGVAEQFALDEAAYNEGGGSAFIVTEPSRDPGLADQLLGARRTALGPEADLTRASLVFITHPGVPGAASTRAYLAAPLLVGGEWRVWPLA